MANRFFGYPAKILPKKESYDSVEILLGNFLRFEHRDCKKHSAGDATNYEARFKWEIVVNVIFSFRYSVQKIYEK